MRKINKLFLLGLLFCSVNMNAHWNWVNKTSSTNNEYARDVSTDNSGNNYLIGSYLGSAIIGTTTLVGIGNEDICLSKINATGAVQWAVRAGGPLIDNGSRVISNGNGTDIFITGTYRGNITFYSTNATIINLTGATTDYECYIAKYNSNGVIQWATSFAGPNDQKPEDIDISAAQSKLYITGKSGNRAFVNCYNFSGSLSWSKISSGTSSLAEGNGIAADANGNCYAIYDVATGNFNIAGSPSYTVNGQHHMAMTKLDASGNFVWGQLIGASSSASIIEQPRDLDLDAAGNIYISGRYSGGSTNISSFTLTNGGLDDVFLAKYNNSGGNAIWARKISGAGPEYPTGQCVDQSTGAVYLAIKNSENNVANLSACLSFSSQIGEIDRKFYVVKYNTAGSVDWALAPILSSNSSQSNGISTNGNKQVMVSGNLIGQASFGNISLNSSSSDGFLAQIDVEPSANTYQICAGQTATISPIGAAGLTYFWYTSSTATTPFTSGSSYTTPVLNSSTIYYVSTILPRGCETPRVPITVNVLPIAVVTAGPDQTICAGSCASIAFTSSTGGVFLTNNTTNQTTGPFFSSPLTVCPTSTTIYTLSNTPSPNYCNGSDGIKILVNPSPTISSDFGLTGTIPLGSAIYYIVTANVASVPTGSSFFWEISEVDDFGNVVPNTTITNPSNWWNPSLQFTNTFPGYDVPISNFVNTTVGNGKFYLGHRYRITRGTWGSCTPWTSTSKEIFLCTNCKTINGQAQFIVENSNYAPSMEEMMSNSKVKAIDIPRTTNVFPNPNNGTFTITSAQLETTLKINIKDLLGKLIYTETKVIKDGKVQLQLNCNKGSYLVEMEDLNTKESKTQKVIIQ